MPSEVIIPAPGEPWQEIIILAMGTIFSALIAILGIFLLYKSKNIFWRRTGYFIGFFSCVGMIGYYIAGTFQLIPVDATGIAFYLQIPQHYLTIPTIVFFIFLLIIIVKNTQTGYRNFKYSLLFFVLLVIERIMIVFLFNPFLKSLWEEGHIVAQPILNFPTILLIINLVSIILFSYLLIKRDSLLIPFS